MKAKTLAELRQYAKQAFCPQTMTLAEPRNCMAEHCNAWREREQKGNRLDPNDLTTYSGWCGLAGALAEENDHTKQQAI